MVTPFVLAACRKMDSGEEKTVTVFIPGSRLRYWNDSAKEFGDYSGESDKNIFGGAKAGRFYDQQIPFIGNNGFYSANYRTVSLLRCDLRWNFLPNQYLTGIVNYLEASESVCDYFNHEIVVDGYPRSYGFWGGALKYTYASKIGPISIDTHMSGFFVWMVYFFCVKIQNLNHFPSKGALSSKFYEEHCKNPPDNRPCAISFLTPRTARWWFWA